MRTSSRQIMRKLYHKFSYLFYADNFRINDIRFRASMFVVLSEFLGQTTQLLARTLHLFGLAVLNCPLKHQVRPLDFVD